MSDLQTICDLLSELPPATAATALAHPTRVRILEVVNERDVSPIQFVSAGLAPSEVYENRDMAAQLSHVSYHFRELKRFGCVVVTDRYQRRGAVEHIYRGVARAYFSDEEWAALSRELRLRISRAMLQGLLARADGAILADTFDSRVDRHLSWIGIEIDERGWGELRQTLARALDEVRAIRMAAAARLENSGEQPVHATVGLLGFESPPPAGPHLKTLEPPPLHYGEF